MGAVEDMLEATPPSPARTWLRYLGLAARFVAGYLIAVAAGAIIFAAIADFVLPGAVNPPQRSFAEWLASTANASVSFFLLGTIFGIPYTLIGLVLFRYLLPRNMKTMSERALASLLSDIVFMCRRSTSPSFPGSSPRKPSRSWRWRR